MEGGRWGLVIVTSGFIIQVLAIGTNLSIGVYNIAFLEYFDNDTVGVSLIASTNLAFSLGAGPLASFLMTKISYRSIAFAGSLLVVLGIFLSRFFPYLPALYLSFGFLTGLGVCLVYLPSHVLSGLYYNKHRSFATGVVNSGSGLGGAIMPIVIGYLIKRYGWQDSLLVLAGMNLMLFLCAAVLRDPPENSLRPARPSKPESLQKVEKKRSAKLETVDERLLETQSDAQPEGLANSKTSSSHSGTASGERFDADEKNTKLHQFSSEEETASSETQENEIISAEQTASSESQGTNVRYSLASRRIVLTYVRRLSVVTMRSVKEKILRHIYLFTDMGFNVYFLSNILWNAAGALEIAFAAKFATECGISDFDAAWLVSFIGLGSFLGGVLGGVLGNLWAAQRMTLYVSFTLTFGLSEVLLPFGSDSTSLGFIMFLGGVAFGGILGLQVIVLTDLIGPINLPDGLGYLMLANGLGCFIGPPLAGTMREASGNYSSAFYTGGALGAGAGVIMVAIPLLRPYFNVPEQKGRNYCRETEVVVD